MSSGVPCSAKYPRGPSPSRGRVSRKQQVPQRSPIRKTQHPRGRPSAKHSTPEVAHPPKTQHPRGRPSPALRFTASYGNIQPSDLALFSLLIRRRISQVLPHDVFSDKALHFSSVFLRKISAKYPNRFFIRNDHSFLIS